jgi:hypothetical protein
MESKKIFIEQKFIENITSDNTFYDIENKTDYNDDNDDELIILETGGIRSNGRPMEIDKMIDYLNSLKINGSSHVEIIYHVDHQEYEMYGYNISDASEDLINLYEKEKEDFFIANNKIKELEKEILEIKVNHNNNYNPSLI